ncbi:MAG: hypothetical protein R3Y04_01540 [Rikenellaceae bacterium]
MRILHYTLGFPPQRSGGMTKYATDLMIEESKQHKVALLYPSGYSFWSRKIKWKQTFRGEIERFGLINTFPIPLLCGIKTPAHFRSIRSMSIVEMESLYANFKPDVFHVHTLMGLPKELLLFFKERGVKLVFTTHDYFGLCPKVNFINHKGQMCGGASQQRCAECNKSAKSTLYLRLRNSKIALRLKDIGLVQRFIK